MTTTAPAPASESYPHYAAAYAEQQASDVSAIQEIRERGWEAFNRIGLPTARRGNEPWKYTNIGPIAREAFSYADFASRGETGPTQAEVKSVAPWQPDWRTLVVIDGAFAPGPVNRNRGRCGNRRRPGRRNRIRSGVDRKGVGPPRRSCRRWVRSAQYRFPLATGSAYPYRPEPMPASSTSCT